MAPLANKLLAAKVTYEISGAGLVPTSNTEATSMFEKLASQVIGLLTLVAVIFFIVQIIFAGYGFLSSQGDEKKMEMNRAKLTNGVLGFFIVIIAVGIGTLIAKLLGFDNPLDIESIFTNMGL